MDSRIALSVAAIAMSIASIVIVLTLYSTIKAEQDRVSDNLANLTKRISLNEEKSDSIQRSIDSQRLAFEAERNVTRQSIAAQEARISEQQSHITQITTAQNKQTTQIQSLDRTLSRLNFNTTEYSGDPVTLAPGQQGISRVKCNPGEIVTGGGFDTADASIIVLHNGVSVDQG